MATYFFALSPIIALIVLGHVLKHIDFIPNEAWAGIEKITYYILFPALLINNLGNQSINGMPWQSIMIVTIGVLLITAIILVITKPLLTENNALFTSIFQGGVRFNTYIMFAVTHALYGDQGLEIGSVAAGFMIVLVNLLCILVFSVWGKDPFQGYQKVIRALFVNPLIIGCCVGWLLTLSGIGLSNLSSDILEIIGQATLPLGLLAVGAGLKLHTIQNHIRAISFASLAQFVMKPLTAFLITYWLGLDEITASVLIIAFTVPTASSSYILARQLGGDTEAMASIITAQTFLGFLLMPIVGALLL